ncbi:MAG TPA: HlyD family efflux transporter periplasmic adaptor subunit [Povalibacter sp.]|nr:HlyD family efflux transporter periplasmic adaptor subunit [Povalibacter sp.]
MIRTTLIGLLGLVLTACGRGDDPYAIVGTLERDRLELPAEAHEPIVEVFVREGDHVDAGAKLLRQDASAIRARLEQAVAARSAAEHRLAELIKGPRSQEISQARAALAAARSSLTTQNAEYSRISDLVERKLLSQSAQDQARAARDVAAGAEKQAAAQLNLLLEGTRREQVEQAEAQLKLTEAALAELQISADRHVVTAPRPGRIEAIPYRLGDRPPAGAPVIVMLADSVPFARVFVPQTRRAEFAAGRTVNVRIDGFDQTFSGRVRFVSAEAAFTPYYALTQEDRTRLSYLAEIDLTDPQAVDIPTGIPVQVTSRQ